MKEWFIHVQGETIGPLLLDTIQYLLKLKRVSLLDFVWSAGLPDWVRLSEVEQFAGEIPPYPSSPVPVPEGGDPAPRSPEAPSRPAVPVPEPGRSIHPPASTRLQIRRHERVRIEGSALIDGKGRFEAEDVSESGISFRTDSPLPNGLEVRFIFESELLGRPIQVHGRVVRSGKIDGLQGFAVEFTGMQPMDRSVIQTYVRAVLFQARDGQKPHAR